MNIIAVDIGNTNINIGLFLDGEEQFIESIDGTCGDELAGMLQRAWQQVPILASSKERKADGVIVVSSVKPAWTRNLRRIARQQLGEKIYLIGKDIPMPMPMWIDEPEKVGTDRVVSAAAAYAVVGDAVVVADLGTAVTIDLVDRNGIFQGGVILPGFDISATALKKNTAQLPKVTVTRPDSAYGKNTTEAINCGLYYSVIGALQEVIRRYAERLGRWPHTVLTGAAAAVIRDDCEFIDSYVPNLVVKGIVMAYQKYVREKSESSLP